MKKVHTFKLKDTAELNHRVSIVQYYWCIYNNSKLLIWKYYVWSIFKRKFWL